MEHGYSSIYSGERPPFQLQCNLDTVSIVVELDMQHFEQVGTKDAKRKDMTNARNASRRRSEKTETEDSQVNVNSVQIQNLTNTCFGNTI